VHGRTLLLVASLVLLLAGPASAGTVIREVDGFGDIDWSEHDTCTELVVSCVDDVPDDTPVTLQAVDALAGWSFAAWTGACTTTERLCEFTAGPGETRVVAHFADIGQPEVLSFELTEATGPYFTWTGSVSVDAVDHETGLETLRLVVNGAEVARDDRGAAPGQVLHWDVPLASLETPADGAVTLAVRADDRWALSDTAETSLTVDRTPPSVAFPRTFMGTVLMEPGALDVPITISDAHKGAVTCRFDRTPISCPTTSTGRTVHLDVAVGAHTLTVTAADLAGNRTTKELKVVGDDGPPTATFAGGPGDGSRLIATGPPGEEDVRVSWPIDAPDVSGVELACRMYLQEARLLPAWSPCTGVPSRPHGHSATVTAGHWVLEIRPTDGMHKEGAPKSVRFTVDPAPGRKFLRPTVRARFDRSRYRATIRVAKLPKNAKVMLRCLGDGCRRAMTRLPVVKGRTDVRRALKKGSSLNAIGELQLRMTAPGLVGRYIRWRAPWGATDRVDTCLVPRATHARPCWD
jgi:hypothetical protein